jgi:hypothetical protein
MDTVASLSKKENTPMTHPTADDWSSAWLEITSLTDGITTTDPRYSAVRCGLACADELFENGKWARFQRAVQGIRALLTNRRRTTDERH